MSVSRILTLATLAAALGGCQTLDQMTQSGQHHVAAPSHPTYCYRTLASVNCYLAPRPGDTLVGIDVPPPAQPVVAKPAEPAAPRPAAAAAAEPVAEPVTGTAPAAPPSSAPAQLSPYGNGGRRTTTE